MLHYLQKSHKLNGRFLFDQNPTDEHLQWSTIEKAVSVQHASEEISRKWFIQQPICMHEETKMCVMMHKSERFSWTFWCQFFLEDSREKSGKNKLALPNERSDERMSGLSASFMLSILILRVLIWFIFLIPLIIISSVAIMLQKSQCVSTAHHEDEAANVDAARTESVSRFSLSLMSCCQGTGCTCTRTLPTRELTGWDRKCLSASSSWPTTRAAPTTQRRYSPAPSPLYSNNTGDVAEIERISSPDDRPSVAAQIPASSPHRGGEGGRLRGALPFLQSSNLHLPWDSVHRRHCLPERRRESSHQHLFTPASTFSTLAHSNWDLGSRQCRAAKNCNTFSIFKSQFWSMSTHVVSGVSWVAITNPPCLLAQSFSSHTDHAAENRPQPLRQRFPWQLWHVSSLFEKFIFVSSGLEGLTAEGGGWGGGGGILQI